MLEEIQRRKRENLYRSMREARSSSRRTEVDGDSMLVLCSNNYLGLTTHDALAEEAGRAAREYGTGAGASRLISGNLEPHRELERRIADLKKTDDALVFSSGYAANVGTVSSLVGEGDVVFSDELNHASIIDGCRLSGARVEVYDHCDADDLRRRYEAADARRKLVVTDSVFSMDGDVAPLGAICDVASDGLVMVDEAHATGVVGDEGAGVVQREGLADSVDVQMGTLSKALASQGGFVAASSEINDLLVNEARSFVYSTGLSPVDAAVARRAVELARGETGDELRRRLAENVEILAEGLEDVGYELVCRDTHILPVLVGGSQEALEVADALEDEGVFAPAIRPPTVPEGTSRIRVSLMATHSRDEVEAAVDAFEYAGEKAGIL